MPKAVKPEFKSYCILKKRDMQQMIEQAKKNIRESLKQVVEQYKGGEGRG